MAKKSKILIVEDTILTVRLLKQIFDSAGYDTSEAYDGEEGLKKVEEYRPDLIVLDTVMPKLDGLEVCKRLKTDENTKHIPIVILTGQDEVSDKIKGLDTGADDYVTKPFHHKELLARVRSLLSRKTDEEKLIEKEKLTALQHVVDEVSHEIINPLMSLGGFARRVHESLPAGSQNQRYMEIILENVAALEKIVKELVGLRHASLSYMEAANINEIIAQALDGFSREIDEKNIEVKTNLMEHPPLLSVDRENLKKAISNMIENAIQAMTSQTKRLGIATQICQDHFEIEISDTGKGVKRDKIKSIFAPFFSSKIYGPGLGLSFTLKTVESHGGVILVESGEGVGTTFTIRLPIRRTVS